MLDIKVDSKKAIAFLRTRNDRIIAETETAVRELTTIGHNLAQSFAPVDTGKLRENIMKKVTRSGSEVTGIVTSNPINGVPYNWYQELGTGQSGAMNVIHERAKSSEKNPSDGFIYNEGITGFGAQPFMYPTYKYLEQNVGRRIQEAVQEGLKK